MLQVAVAISAPAVFDVDQVPWLQPLQLRHRGNHVRGDLLGPALHVPAENMIASICCGLRLQHHRSPRCVAGVEERPRDAAVGVAVDAVGINGLYEARHDFPVALRMCPGAVVPGHCRQKHLDPTFVEVGHYAAQPIHAAGQVVRQIELVAIVDADVRINIPEQHAVDSAVATLQIVEIAIHGVAACDRIVEVAVFHHQQGMHEIALRPLQFGTAIDRIVVAETQQMLAPPFAKPLNPVISGGVDVDHPLTYRGERPTRGLAWRGQIRTGQRMR